MKPIFFKLQLEILTWR